MEVYFLLFVTFILLIFVLYIDKNLFSPSAIICESFFISLFVLSLNINEWNVNLSLKTVLIILVGNIVFVFTSIFYENTLYKKWKKVDLRENNPIIIGQINYYLMLIFCLFISIVYILSFYETVGGFSNLDDLSKAINYYRVSVSYNLGSISELPTIVVQLFKILKAFSLICMYIFINNYFFYKNQKLLIKSQFKYLLPMILFVPLSLLSGNRSELSTIIISIIIIWNIKSISFGYKFNLKRIQKYAVLLILLGCMFSITKNITGRTSELHGFDYFSIYFGAPIELLDLYVKNPPEKSNIVGKETFWSLNNTLIGITNGDKYNIHLEVRYSNNFKLGNVYTAYRSMYQDFGFGGMIILQVIVSIVFTKMYSKIKYNKSNSKISTYELMYSLMIHVLFFYSFNEQFYNTIISVNYLTLIIIFNFIIFFLTKVNFNVKRVINYEVK